MMNTFLRERLIGTENGERKSLYDPLSRSNVKTMSSMKQTARIKKKDVSMDGEVMYIRLLAMNSHKRVPLNSAKCVYRRRCHSILHKGAFYAQA